MNPAPTTFFSPPQSAVPFSYPVPYPPNSAHQASPYHAYPASIESTSQASQKQQQQQQQHQPNQPSYFRQFPPRQRQQQQQPPQVPHVPVSAAPIPSSHLGQQPLIHHRNVYNVSRQQNAGPNTVSEYNGNSEANLTALATQEAQDDNDAVDEDDDEDQNDPVFHLPAPPEETHPSEAELEEALHAWSLEHGYELVKRASKKNAQGQIYKRYFHCSKHGSRSRPQLASETRKRANRKSNRIGCPMSVASVAVDPSNPEGQWQIRHRKSHHNHGPLDGLALAGHRRRARGGNVEKAVDGLFAIGTATAQVLQFLQKTHPNGLFTRTDVANMKLKWKKNGTCADQAQRQTTKQSGDLGPACIRCRQKHDGCSKERPTCRNCALAGALCTYDGELNQSHLQPMSPGDDAIVSEQDEPSTTSPQQQATASGTRHAAVSQKGPTAEQVARTKEILADLQSFQREHVVPRKLHLTSSSVEVLAQSSCGTGNSYRPIPILYQEQDWPAFRDAMVEAARRENHHDVLIGKKLQPSAPPEPTSNQSTDEIEDWNEYIRQLAIFNRRNELLLAALASKLAPNFRNHTHTLSKAHDVWTVLDELCLPRGSQQAYSLYNKLHCITLAESSDLNDYIGRLEATYAQFKLLKLNQVVSATPASESQRPSTGADVMPDESMCLLFLRNLGPAWKRWAEGLLATNNIAGFGTGQRVGFRDVCRRAVGYEAMQRQTLDA